MRATRFSCLISMAGVACVTSGAWAYEAFQGPTELIQYDPARASNGYTLLTLALGRNTYLIDMNGQVVHRWSLPESWRDPGVREHARFLEDGNLIRGANIGAGSIPDTYQLVNWAGEVVPDEVTHDSVSFFPALSNPEAPSRRDWIYADEFFGGFGGVETADYAMRAERYKLLRFEGREEFYDLHADPYEYDDLLRGELSTEQRAAYEALQAEVLLLRGSE